jgi:site-specific recombinase XerD
VTEASIIDIPALLPSWQRSLRAANRSPRTVQSYAEAATQFSDFLVRKGMPSAVDSIRREHVESFIEDLQALFKSTTVGVRFRSLQQFVQVASRGRGDHDQSDGPDAHAPRGRSSSGRPERHGATCPAQGL